MAELRRVSRAPGPPRLSAGPAVARELAVRSGPRSVGAPALHLMRSGCVSQPGAPAARSHSPSNAPARARNAHHLAGPRTHRNAQTRGAAIHPPAPRDARNAPRPGTLPVAAGGHGPGSGREGRQLPSRFSFHNSLSGFCAAPAPRGGSASSRSRPGVQPAPTLVFRPGLFRFPSSLTRLLFSLPSGSPGKVASLSLLKSLPSLRGGGLDWGRVRARSIPGARAGERRRPPHPPTGSRARSRGWRSAAREHPDFPQDPGRLLLGRNSSGPASILSMAPPRSPKPLGLKESAPTVARRG